MPIVAGPDFQPIDPLGLWKKDTQPTGQRPEQPPEQAKPGSYEHRLKGAESSHDSSAVNQVTDARGDFQFIPSTWEDLRRRHPELGLTPEGRDDSSQQAKAIEVFRRENAAALRAAGVPVDDASEYAAHFLGSGDAPKVLKASDDTPLTGLIRQASIDANPFLKDMTVGDFKAWTRRKIGAADATPQEFKPKPNQIVADETYQPQDAAGLYRGRDNPLTPKPKQQPGADLATFVEKLNADEPGRYEIVPEDQYPQWREEWEKAQPSQFMKGLKGALVDQNPEMLGNALDALGVLFGSDQVREWGDAIADYGRTGSWKRQARVGSLQNIRTDSFGNFIDDTTDYLAYQLGSGIGSSAPSLVTGTATALATGNPIVGMLAGAAGPSYVQNLGDVYGALRDDPGVYDRLSNGELSEREIAAWASAAAVPMAALDAFSLERVIGIGSRPLKRALIKRVAHGLATGALTEGSTEALQEVISLAVQDVLGSEKTRSEQVISVLDNAIGGALAGGAMGGAAHAPRSGQEEAEPITAEEAKADAQPRPRSGPLTSALEHGARREHEAAGGAFVLQDPGGDGDGHRVVVSADQSGVPASMRRVIDTVTGLERVVGDRLLVPAAPAAPAAAPTSVLPPAEEAAGAPSVPDEQPATIAPAEPSGPGKPVPGAGSTVRVVADGVEPFVGKLEAMEGEEAIVSDPATGEVYQVPAGALQSAAGDERLPETSSDAALRPAEPEGPEISTEPLPPKAEQKPASEAFPEPPTAGQRVIVDPAEAGLPGEERFAAKVVGYTGDEAVVQRDDGAELQVPVTALQVSKLTKKQVEKQDLERNPPVDRETITGSDPVAREVNGKQVRLPDEVHSRLFDLGRMRRDSQRTTGAGMLDRDRVSPAEQAKLAKHFGMSTESLGQVADDYRYRVERATRKATTRTPINMHPVSEKIVQRMQGEERRDAQRAEWAAEDAAKEGAPATPAAAAPVALEEAAHQAATSPNNDLPEPTEGQKEAGNYPKGHVRIGGLDVSIENPVGSQRSGTDRSGQPWSVTMKSHYGYIRGTVGRDKDHIDIFIKRNADALDDASPIFVVDQVDPDTGRFDEHKVLAGFPSAGQAQTAYLANYAKDWQGLGKIHKTTLGGFKRWLKQGNTTRPYQEVEVPSPEPVGEMAHRNAVVVAEDSGEAVTISMNRTGPWDFNDTWPEPDPERIAGMRREGRDPFVTGDDVEQVAYTLAEGLNEIMSEEATVRGTAAQLEQARNGAAKPPKRSMTREDWIAQLEKENRRAKRDVADLRATYADVFGDRAADAMLAEARKRLDAEARTNQHAPKPAPQAADEDAEAAKPAEPSSKVQDISHGAVGAGALLQASGYAGEMTDAIHSGKPNRFLLEMWSRHIGKAKTSASGDIPAGGRIMARANGKEMDILVPVAGGKPRWVQLKGKQLAEAIREALAAPKPVEQLRTKQEEQSSFAADIAAYGNFKPGDRVEWTNNNYDPPRVFTGTVAAKQFRDFKKTGTLEVVADGGRNGDGYDVSIGAAQLRHIEKEAKAENPADRTQPETKAASPKPPAAESPAPEWGANNKLVTRDRADQVRARLRAKLKTQLSAGIDPEILALGAELAAFHIEAGARRFADFAKAVAGDMETTVEKLRPYLRSWYNGARDLMEDSGADIAGMDDAETVRAELAKLKDAPDEPAKLDRDGPQALEGTPSGEVSRAGEGGQAGSGPAARGEPDLFGGERAGEPGRDTGRGLAGGEGAVSPAAARDERAAKPDRGTEGAAVRNDGAEPRRDGAGRPELSDSGPAREPVDAAGSAATPAQDRADDYTVTDEDEIGRGGAKTKFRNNVAAIRLLRTLESERRNATRSEQAVLAKWVGWGGLRPAFGRDDGSVAKGWEREAAELKELLSEEEYRAAESSTRNAHYTSPEIVNAIWSAVDRLGFKGGQVLEPSVGAGNFLGLMPPALRPTTRVTGVELDRITGGIARYLYPKASIQAPKGFQDITVPDGHFDLAVGNPPFGSEKLYDADKRHLNKFSIHNYFFAKSVEGLKPNGVLAMVITNRFLDGASAGAREHIAGMADLVAAIRLPNTAFLENAGTEVTTDIVILRKRREGETRTGPDWTQVREFTDREGRKVPLNLYFHAKPEMMLGEFGAYGTMYGPEEPALIARPGDDLPALLAGAIDGLPRAIMDANAATAPEAVTVPREIGDVPEGSLFLADDGEVWLRKPDSLGEVQGERVEFPNEKAGQRIKGMVRIRDAFSRLRKAQLDESATDEKLATLRERLNKVYDKFVSANGPVNQDANKRLFRDDPTWPQISALENDFDKGISPTVAKNTGETARKPSAKKAPIFTERTQQPYRRPTSASSAKDALATVLADLGRVDLDAMQRLYRKPVEEIVKELGDLLYRTPEGAYETADQYLSGNVRKKLAVAEEAAKSDRAFQRNVEALRDVVPADIEPVDIDLKAGSPWVPPVYVEQFIDHITGNAGGKATYAKVNAKWIIGGSNATDANDARWGTARASVGTVLDAALNGKAIQIYDRHSDATILNQPETDAANEKVERVKAEWRSWIWQDDNRRAHLARLYNDTFNTDALRVYDGSHLTLPGKVSDEIVKLRPHQKNFVWRVLQGSTTLADHTVGAGKTFALIASAMELRRTKQANKPMFVVPNHLVGQWAADFIKLYPGAQILAATKKDFEAGNRKRLFARIATGNWDAVIVAHSSFGKIAVEPQYEARFISNQIAEIEESIKILRQETGQKSRNVSQLTKWRDALSEKMKRLLDAGTKDDSLNFDELGVDALFVDEAHEFKNLAFSTSMQRVAGLGNPAGSNKAFDLYLKVNNVLDRTGGRNIVFATGTPLSNTMAEMYTMQRYLDGKALNDLGLSAFDAWAKVFGEVVNDWELAPSGQYKLNSRFAKFVNMPELMQRYRSFADVITNDDIKRQLAERGEKLPLPKVKGGKPQNVVVERSRDQAGYIGTGKTDDNGNLIFPEGSLVYRAEHLPTRPSKGQDNMLKIMSDARKAALDMRLIDPGYPDVPGSKVHVAADNMARIYKRWTSKRGAQLVFIDLSTPKAAKGKEAQKLRELLKRADEGDEAASAAIDKMSPDEFLALDGDFSVYDDLKQKLIDRGIPENEIAFIHDANTELQKEDLFAKVRSGRVRFLFGSTPKMGAGTNVQNRLVALHHLDAPWRPSDLEQRDGRGIRQGNELYAEDPDGFEIEILRYATRNTLDARQWQTIEGKARFIEQVRKGDSSTRVVEDIAGEAANAAEMKAAASGNPLILEEMDLRQKLRKMEGQAAEHAREQHRIRSRIKDLEASRVFQVERLPVYRADAALAQEAGAAFDSSIGGKPMEKPKDMGAAIIAAGRAMLATEEEERALGNYGKFRLSLSFQFGDAFALVVDGNGSHSVHIDDIGNADPVGLARRVMNTVSKLVMDPEEAEQRIEQIDRQVPQLKAQVGEWKGADELEKVRARHREVLAELQPKKPAAKPGDAAPQTSERRSSLVDRGEPFYSAVERAIEGIGQDKAAPAQWKAMIAKTPGVKAEEIEWLGLDEWLGKQTGSIDKAALLDFVRANQIEVEEVVNRPGGNDEAVIEWHGVAKADWDKLSEDEKAEFRSEYAEEVDAPAGTTKYDNYTLPGGQNYRELLLTLPSGDPASDFWAAVREHHDLSRQFWNDLDPHEHKDLAQEYVRHTGDFAPFDLNSLEPPDSGDADFLSGHWPEPNVVAHVRFNERGTEDGKRTLHIEEIQSDWHQAGRKEGYEDGKEKWFIYEVGGGLKRPLSGPYDKKIAAVEAVRRTTPADPSFGLLVGKSESRMRVPDAPFKTTWPELVFKRMLRWAVDHGLDRITWTPGDLQVDRFNLEQVIRTVEYRPRKAGAGTRYEFEAIDDNGKIAASRESATLDEVAEDLGKDIAKRFEADDGKLPGKESPWRVLRDLEQKVGGEGMRGFYDDILPRKMRNLVKKWGGKVEPKRLEQPDGVKVWSIDITDPMREAAAAGLPLFSMKSEARAHGLPSTAAVISTYRHVRPMKASDHYVEAKAGDPSAAVRLVEALVKPENIAAARDAFGPDSIFLPVVAREESGHNAIPRVLAEYYAAHLGARTGQGVYQVNRAYHTGASAIERVLARAQFAGPIEAGKKYVLVDDVSVMGSTLAELANHIISQGGEVSGVVALVNASRTAHIAPSAQQVREIERRFGDVVTQELGLEPAALTGDEARYLLNFRGADTLRARVASGRGQRSERLRQKGVREVPLQRSPEPVSGTVLAALRAGPAGPLIDPLLNSGRLKIGSAAELGAKPNEHAWTMGDGTMYLVSDRLTPENASSVLLHEAFHSGRDALFAGRTWSALMKRLESLYRQYERSGGRAGKYFKQARRRVQFAESVSPLSQKLQLEEFAAYAIEHYESAPRTLQRWVDDLVGQVKAWLLRRFGRQIGKVTPAQLRALALEALRSDAAGPTAAPETRETRQSLMLDRTQVTDQLSGSWTDMQPKTLALVPLNYFSELKRPNMGSIDDYLKLKRGMDTYRGNKHAEMDAIAQGWRKFAGSSPKHAAALADIMHEATLAGVDPSKTDAETRALPGYAALRQRFEALPTRAREIFGTARDAYKAQQAELDKLIIANVEKAAAVAEKKAEERYQAELERLKRSNIPEPDRRDQIENLQAQRAADKIKSGWARKARMTRMRAAFEASRVPEPYFPLARFGRYFVAVRDMTGDVISFSRFEKEADRRAWVRANRAEINKAFPGSEMQLGVLDNAADLKQAMDPRILSEIEGILNKSGVDAIVMDAIWQRYLATMPDLSLRKRYIHRKGVAGFHKDALRAFGSHMFHASHQMGRLKYGIDLAEAVNEAADEARKSDDPTRGMTLVNELRRRHEWVMNPKGSKAAQYVTSTMFVWYLGMTPAAAMVNMTQTPLLGVPILGARLGGTLKSAAAITRAAAQTVNSGGSVMNASLSADERAAMEAFNESGLIDRTQSHELAGVGETGVEYSPMRQRVMSIVSWAFHRAEVWNREVTALAAYRLARAKGENHQQAVDTAHDLTWKVHFDYSNSSRARVLQSDAVKMVAIFQNYQLNMWYRLFRDLHQSFKGETPQARKEARYQLAGIAGMMTLMGGVTGFFGYNVLMAIAGLFFGDDDDPLGFKNAMERHIVELFGPELGGMILKGVPGHVAGIDLTSRIGMPDFFVRAPDPGLEGRDWMKELIVGLGGVVPSTAMNVVDGFQLVGEGKVARGVEMVAPKFVKDLMKAYRYTNEGLATRRGDEILSRDQIETWQMISQALGFTPARISETYERSRRLRVAEQHVLDERRELVNRWAMAVRLKDAETRKSALDAILAWNRKGYARGIQITQDTLKRSLATRARNAAKRQEGALIENEILGKRLRAGLSDALYR